MTWLWGSRDIALSMWVFSCWLKNGMIVTRSSWQIMEGLPQGYEGCINLYASRWSSHCIVIESHCNASLPSARSRPFKSSEHDRCRPADWLQFHARLGACVWGVLLAWFLGSFLWWTPSLHRKKARAFTSSTARTSTALVSAIGMHQPSWRPSLRGAGQLASLRRCTRSEVIGSTSLPSLDCHGKGTTRPATTRSSSRRFHQRQSSRAACSASPQSWPLWFMCIGGLCHGVQACGIMPTPCCCLG